MQINNARQKRKNIARALESIPGPAPNHRIQISTESAEIKPIQHSQPFKLIRQMDPHEERDARGLKQFYRYKQAVEQQKDGGVGKYKSLQLARRGVKKRSEQKIVSYNSIDNSPYRLAMAKRSANNLQLVEQIKEQPFLAKRLSRQNRKSSLPKKMSISLSKKKEAILERYRKVGGESADELKDMTRAEIKRGNFTAALKLISKVEEGAETDIELLDLGGVCLMHLKQFDAAVQKFKRLIALDKHFNKQVYISLALCYNQLNRTAECLSYVEQCIGLFPNFYEGFYFKGKVLFGEGKLHEALQALREAGRLNGAKKQINLLMGECHEKMGNTLLAAEYYKSNIVQVNIKNLKYVARLANILTDALQEQQAMPLLVKFIAFIDSLPSRSRQVDGYALECNYLLCLAYYRQSNFEMVLMKGEEILKSMNSEWILKTIPIMIVVNVRQHNLYGAIYFVERLEYFKVSTLELKEYVTFCQGVVQLIKKKTVEGVAKLQELNGFFHERQVINELNGQINKVYHMYLSYAYLLMGQYSKALHEIEMQNQLQVSAYYRPILQYNQAISRAIVEYNHLRFDEANRIFQDSLLLFPDKVETKLYMVICNFKLYYRASLPDKQTIRLRIRNFLNECADAVSEVNSNYSAHIFYFKGLYHAWQEEWAEAACDLDIAIEKSEDNFFDFFYLRALVLANLQSYKPAINDVSVAISLQEDSASGYLLRARCLQIDGNPTQAFADLQTFIDKLALRPQDKQIHKFAGHMLFENGAFEDALQAYSQGDLNKFDIEVYLTRSKTYFLLGNFQKASADMLEAARTVPDRQEYIFDYEMMKWLGELLHQFVKNQTEDEYVFNSERLAANLEQLLQLYKGGGKESGKYGKIFKLSEFLTLSALCYFYLQEYNKAIDNIIEAIELKKASIEIGEELQGDYQQEQTEKLVFINQMYYNVALCFCMLNDYPNAERYLKKCRIAEQLHNHEIFLELLSQIKGTVDVQEKEVYMDLFSLRNKLSRYIPKVRVPFLCKKDDRICYREMKLCFPYPKVEPPEISPAFQTRLLTEIDINQIERRPEAPWIYKENNSVKFTDRIDVYSRFEMEKSEVEKSAKKIHMGDFLNSMSDSSVSMHGQAMKKKLLLDSDVEQKLNKLINKAMNKAK